MHDGILGLKLLIPSKGPHWGHSRNLVLLGNIRICSYVMISQAEEVALGGRRLEFIIHIVIARMNVHLCLEI